MQKPVIAIFLMLCGMVDQAVAENQPVFLKDRGKGVATSMFGTYVEDGELILFPFYEYYKDKDAEYSPNELGYGLDQDFRGKYEAHEFLFFAAYGLTQNIAVEVEMAMISAKLYTSPSDPTLSPDLVEESGLGDVEGQLRWRFREESDSRPEMFTYFETVLPLQKDKVLIGTQDWEFKLGLGVNKGFGWGNLSFRAAVEYDGEDGKLAPGEYAFEYFRRHSHWFKYYIGTEGSDDEVEFITNLEFALSKKVALRVNNAFGVTSKATDYAPELGVMFRF